MGYLKELFLTIVNMSATAAVVIILVLVIRFFIKKAPKWMSYLLWGVVGFRLLCPYSVPSTLSVFNLNMVQRYAVADDRVVWNFTQSQREEEGAGEVLDERDEGQAMESATVPKGNETKVSDTSGTQPTQRHLGLTEILSYVWLTGMLFMAGREMMACRKLKHLTAQATKSGENVYECDMIDVPFVMGIVKPKIYLPYRLTEEERGYVLLHEQKHIRRYDYLAKLVGVALLCVHWFNPLVWVAYYLMCKDMEMSCDEAVIKQLGDQVKQSYSSSILSFATPGMRMAGGRLAFGETSAKARIQNVLNYKKPVKILICVAAVLCIGTVAFGTGNAVQKNRIAFESYFADSHRAETVFSYQVQRQVKSYLLYRELYVEGQHTAYQVISSGTFGVGAAKRRGDVNVVRDFKNTEGDSWEAAMDWEIPGASASEDVIELGKYGFRAMAESNGLEPYSEGITPVMDEPITMLALNLGYDGPVRGRVIFHEEPDEGEENDGEVLYKLVFSERSEAELKAGYQVYPDAQALFALRTPYLGDAPAVGRLVQATGAGELGAYSLELETNTQPYCLMLHFKERPEDEEGLNREMYKKAALLLALIENADEVQWTYPRVDNGEEVEYRLYSSVGQVEEMFGVEGLKKYGVSAEVFQELLKKTDVISGENNPKGI